MYLKNALRRCALTLLSILFISFAYSQTSIKVSGLVKDDSGKPVQGATVAVKDGKQMTITKEDGRFELSVASSTVKLLISSVGYADKEIALNGQTSLTISLTSTSSMLQDVVVGVMVRRKRRM